MNSELKNPNKDLPDEQVVRSTIEYSYAQKAAINKYEPKNGIVQTTALILINKLIHELERSPIQQGDRTAYHVAVGNCRIILCDKDGKSIIGVTESNPERSTAPVPTTRSKRVKPINGTN